MEILFRKTVCVVFVCLSLLLLNQPIVACSWDYPIWQIRDKNADPLYRFIKNGKAGYIDQKGMIVVKPTLDSYGDNQGDQFSDGLLLTEISEGPYIDKMGKVVLDTKYYRNWDFSDGLAVAMKEDKGKWGFIDKSGKFVITPRFESYPNGYVHSFSEGLAMIDVKKRYGYIDRTGKFVIAPQFLQGNDFSEGLARVVIEGPCLFVPEGPCNSLNIQKIGDATDENTNNSVCKFTFIDKSGKTITNQRFTDAKDFSEGLAAVQLRNKWGFINKQGEFVISPQFEEVGSFLDSDAIRSFSDGLALVKTKGLWGYIDKSGKFVIPPTFEIAENFSNGLAPVGEWNKKERHFDNYYYINKSGKQAFKGRFAEASHYFKGLAHVKLIGLSKDNAARIAKFSYIDITGNTVFSYEVNSDDFD